MNGPSGSRTAPGHPRRAVIRSFGGSDSCIVVRLDVDGYVAALLVEHDLAMHLVKQYGVRAAASGISMDGLVGVACTYVEDAFGFVVKLVPLPE